MNEQSFWGRVPEPAPGVNTIRARMVREALRAVAGTLAAAHDEAQVEDALVTIAADASDETLAKLGRLLR